MPPSIPGSARRAASRSGCRIAAADRSSSSTRICRSSWPRPQASGAGGRRVTVHRCRAADLRRRRSRQGAEAGRGARRRLPDAAGVSRRALSEPVQPLRPAVARVPAGRRRGAPERRGHRAVLRAQQRRHDGAAVGARRRTRSISGPSTPTASTSIARRRSPAAPRPATARARRWPRSKRWPKKSCRPRSATTGPTSRTRRGRRPGPR